VKNYLLTQLVCPAVDHHHHSQIAWQLKSQTKLQGCSKCHVLSQCQYCCCRWCALSYDLRNSSVFNARLKVCSDGNDVIAGSSMFQTLAAATGKARSNLHVLITMNRIFWLLTTITSQHWGVEQDLSEASVMCCFVAVESWKSRDCLQQHSAISFILLKSLSRAIDRGSEYAFFCKRKFNESSSVLSVFVRYSSSNVAATLTHKET